MTVPYALQTTRKDILVHDPSFTQYRTVAELYPAGSTCFVLANPYYGCEATVRTISAEHKGRIQIALTETQVRDSCSPSVTVQYLNKQDRLLGTGFD